MQPVPPKTVESKVEEEKEEEVTHSGVDMLLNAAPEGSADGDPVEAPAARTCVTHHFGFEDRLDGQGQGALTRKKQACARGSQMSYGHVINIHEL